MTLADILLADFRVELGSTRKYLEAVPDDKFDWKPHEKSMTLGELVAHLAENPSWVSQIAESDLDFATADYKPLVVSSRAEALAVLDEYAAAFEAALEGKSDDAMLETWTMRNGDAVLMQSPRHAALRSTGLHHWIHHRGQLCVYLRLLGVPVPGVYGPTADDTSMMP